MIFKQFYDPKLCPISRGEIFECNVKLNNENFKIILPKNYFEYSHIAVDNNGEVYIYQSFPGQGYESWYNQFDDDFLCIGSFCNEIEFDVEFENWDGLLKPLSLNVSFDE